MNIRTLAIGLLSTTFVGCYAVGEQSVQTIETINQSSQPLHISANSPTAALHVEQTVPAYTHALIVSMLTKLQSPQDLLLSAIVNDSAFGVKQARQAGANINQEILGKSPVLLAASLKRYDALQCLLELGAR